jgi:phage FluMu gp28-like protein
MINLIFKSASARAEWEESVRQSLFLGYQKRWKDDRSRNKAAEKSRQIGFSWCDAYDTVTETALQSWPFDCWVTSRDQIQAQLYGADCKYWSDILQLAAGDLGEAVVDQEKKISALRLPLANQHSIWSLSSNVDAQAGKRGTRKLDEFALNPDNRLLYSIAKPGTTWGGRLVIFSTPRGTANFFNELIEDIKTKGNPKKFSLHTVTLEDALRDGLLVKLKQRWVALNPDDDRLRMDEYQYLQMTRDECADEESFLQEYMCVPGDDNSAFLDYDLIAGCQYRADESWENDLDQAAELYIGVDIGRTHDLTVIWIMEKVGGVYFTRRVIEVSKEMFSSQEERLYPLIAHPKVRRCCIDSTGLGKQFAERAQQRFGKYKVEAVSFTPGVKEELAYPVRAAFEYRNLRIPDNKFIRSDLRGIRKETTTSGNIRFTGERGKDGHCDRFWALALALHAGKRNPANYYAEVI